MGQSWCFIIIISVFLLYISGAFSDPVRVKVEGFVGDSAILSCSIPEYEIQDKIVEFSAPWRDDERKKVCDITKGNRRCKDQDPKYKDRVEVFPEEYKKGNFSIKLNSLQKTDARKYICHITGPSQNPTITELHVEEGPGGRGNHRRLKIDGELLSIVLFLFRFFLAGILFFFCSSRFLCSKDCVQSLG